MTRGLTEIEKRERKGGGRERKGEGGEQNEEETYKKNDRELREG